MPKVGDKEFDYTPEGVAAAKEESAATGMPMSDGAMRSVQKYAGGGEVGYARIGVDPVPEPEYRGQTFDRTAQEWEDGGDVEKKKVSRTYWKDGVKHVEYSSDSKKEKKSKKKEKKTLKEKIQSVAEKLKLNKKSSKKSEKDKNIKKNMKKINKLDATQIKVPKNVDTTKSKPTGKLKKGMQSVTITEGGAYPTYKKKSKPAKSFRKAFSEAKGEGKKTFTWDGRKYTTKVK